jgi:Leucine-rich repeat (LRR) protein
MSNKEKLYYIDKNLKILPNIPLECRELYCGFNQITELPKLPVNLSILKCNNNQIKNLPLIPDKCIELDCSYNQIKELPEKLPINLITLNISNNQITELPKKLPQFLKTLDCSNNQITELPNYSEQYRLVNLYCAGNKITKITLDSRIKVIDISFNATLKDLIIPEDIGNFTLILDINQFKKFSKILEPIKNKIFLRIYIPSGTNKNSYKKSTDFFSRKQSLEMHGTNKISTLGFRGAEIIENYNITIFSNNIKNNIIKEYNLGNSYKISSRIEGGSKTVKNSKNPKKINMKKSELQKIALKNKVSLKKRDGTMKKKDELIKSLKLKKLL